jgi:hypothetical protein
VEVRASSPPYRTARTSTRGITHIVPPPADDRVARGRALREEIPRESHGYWKPQPGRPYPIDLLKGHGADSSDLVGAWYDRMVASPLAFFERTAAIMAHDLAATPTTGILVQLCGDCHAASFGSYWSADRTLLFDLRDFDETLPGPWEWDVKRLATGFVMAGRNNGLSAARSRDTARNAVQSYREHMIEFAAMRTLSGAEQLQERRTTRRGWTAADAKLV